MSKIQDTPKTTSSRINRSFVVAVVLISLSAVASIYFWSTNKRYYMVTTSSGVIYEIDRKTGTTWMIMGNNKLIHEEPEHDIKLSPLPIMECSEVTGNGGISSGYFSGKIYNGSNWVVRRIVVGIKAFEADGSTKWDRKFAATVHVPPLETARFSVEITGDHGVDDTSWRLVEIEGHPQ